jgi:hypothetical protein
VPAITIEQARAAKETLRALLSEHDAVNGIGITSGDQGYAVAVNLRRPLTANEHIPDYVDGVRVETRTVGNVHKLPA